MRVCVSVCACVRVFFRPLRTHFFFCSQNLYTVLIPVYKLYEILKKKKRRLRERGYDGKVVIYCGSRTNAEDLLRKETDDFVRFNVECYDEETKKFLDFIFFR